MDTWPSFISLPAVLAYLDPGTGSLILQILMAAFFAALMTVQLWWRRFTAFIHAVFSKRDDDGARQG